MNTMILWFRTSTSWLFRTVSAITAIDILEILVLAFLVYNILLWIKDSRAWTLLKGIMVLGIFVFVIYALQMETLMYLVNRAIDIAIMAAIVIFQPELRKALEQLGQKQFVSSIFSFDNGKMITERFSDKTADEIVRASFEMSKVKTGALIVIEQNIGLQEYEETGIRLDSLVSSQLLINIFEHNTPLHDGAVVIRGDRITAATCYLPLSANMLLSKDLGTRHRAGVGISEVTDSLTIIVSEETGAVSVAYKGELKGRVDREELRKQLLRAQNKAVIQKKFRLWKGWKENEA